MSKKKKIKSGNRKKVWLRRGLIVLELCVLILLIAAVGLFYKNSQKREAIGSFSWEDHKTTVHALGGLDGKTYLNSKEGFEYYYNQGSRLFEVDLSQTADGVWVCRHNWKTSMGQWEGDGKKVLMASDFKNTPLYEQYTTMTLEDLFLLLKKYPDAYVLIDCKEYSTRDYENTLEDYKAYAEIAKAAGAESVLNQMIPEIYNSKMLAAVQKVHSFPSYIYSLWKEYSVKQLKRIAQYCKEKKIPVVTISAEYWTEEAKQIFDEQGIQVYIYTVNDAKEAKEFLKAGAIGVCTDTLLETELTGKEK